MNSLSTETLADLIDKRYRCLIQLRDLGRKQAHLIEAGEINALLRLIATKNQLIAALQAIEKGLSPFHQQDPEQRTWTSSEVRANCQHQAEACQQLLEEVMALERSNEKQMTTRRDKVASQLQAAQAASSARGAYQAHQKTLPQGPHQSSSSPATSSTTTLQGQQLDLQSDV